MKLLRLYRLAFGTRALLSGLLLIMPLPMWATLGDNATSVLSDRARMKGVLNSVDNRTYVVHEITMSSGSKVREYVSPAGAVFGVAWEGQPPDLRQLLGPYYQQAQQAQAAVQSAQNTSERTPRARRVPVAIQTPGLVLYQAGHIRHFHGVAYIPQLLPQGVQPSVIH